MKYKVWQRINYNDDMSTGEEFKYKVFTTDE